MSSLTAAPRLLLVEDDAVSRAFLSEALSPLPANVDAVASIAAACQLAKCHTYDLYLIDAHLPDGDGAACLTSLRRLQEKTPALAVTAEAFHDEFDRLLAAGFIQVLQKPIAVAALQTIVQRMLSENTCIPTEAIDENPPVWDQTRALAAVGGRHETLLALRTLFLTELPLQRQDIMAANLRQDAESVRATLHKLKASCGFVGATRLLAAVQAFSQSPLDLEKRELFDLAVRHQLDTQF